MTCFDKILFSINCISLCSLGETLENAGYASWTPMKEDLKETYNKRCGAISRTGFLKTTYCNSPAMFLCERIINKTKINAY